MVGKGNLSRTGILCLVLTLCLAGLGAGYAHWNKSLDINGIVETGEVDVEFLQCNVTEINDPVGIGQITALCNDTDGDGDLDAMVVRMANVTACYEAEVTFDVHNNGSVPVVVKKIDILVDDTPSGSPAFDIVLQGIAPGDEIDPCDSKSCTLSVHVITDEQGCYDFSIEIEVANWNEGGGP